MYLCVYDAYSTVLHYTYTFHVHCILCTLCVDIAHTPHYSPPPDRLSIDPDDSKFCQVKTFIQIGNVHIMYCTYTYSVKIIHTVCGVHITYSVKIMYGVHMYNTYHSHCLICRLAHSTFTAPTVHTVYKT